MDAEKYIDILNSNILYLFFNEDKLIYQGDNDPKHTELVKIWKNDYQIKSIDWPSNSPDLNPIENVWHILKSEIEQTQTNSTEEFIKCIEDKWKHIPIEIINKIIGSMKRRCEKIIESNGEHIDY